MCACEYFCCLQKVNDCFTGNHDGTIDLQKSGGLTWKMWAEIL